MRHLAAVFEDKRYDLSHKSIVDDLKSVTAAKKRKIWHLKRKSVKRAFKAYTLRPKRKSKQVWILLPDKEQKLLCLPTAAAGWMFLSTS